MADSVTYEEFVKQENRKSEMSPTDTETTLEDLQSTISEIQDSLKTLSTESKTNQIQQETMQKEVQQFIQEFQIAMNQKMESLQLEVAVKLQVPKQTEDSDSSIWEISSTSSSESEENH